MNEEKFVVESQKNSELYEPQPVQHVKTAFLKRHDGEKLTEIDWPSGERPSKITHTLCDFAITDTYVHSLISQFSNTDSPVPNLITFNN